jgi:hypothetical protein
MKRDEVGRAMVAGLVLILELPLLLPFTVGAVVSSVIVRVARLVRRRVA